MFILAQLQGLEMDELIKNPNGITTGAALLMILYLVLNIIGWMVKGFIQDRRLERDRVKATSDERKAVINQDVEQTRLSYEAVNQQQQITAQTLQMLANLMATSTQTQEGIRQILQKTDDTLSQINLKTTDIHRKTDALPLALDAVATRLESPLLKVLERGEVLFEMQKKMAEIHQWVANDRAAWEKQLSLIRERNTSLQKMVDSLKPPDADVGDVPPVSGGEGTDSRAAESGSEVAGTA